MKKIIRGFKNVLQFLLVFYVLYFLVWLVMITACSQLGNVCGDDLMTKTVRVGYGWIFTK